MPNGHTDNWPELAIRLYDRLTDRQAEITYDFQDMKVHVPSGTGNDANWAEWKLSGALSIRTQNRQ